MRIYIDESGTFNKSKDRDFSISCVGALVLPEYSEEKIFRKYQELRNHFPKTSDGEIKGRSLNEPQIAKVIDLLRRNSALYEAVLIDMNTQDEEKLHAQKKQIEINITRKLSPQFIEMHKKWIAKLIDETRMMSPQLFAQAMLTTELIHRTIQHATAYFSQRAAKELGNFQWYVDAKSPHGLTSSEHWWKETVAPFLASTSRSSPAMLIPCGDYSHYDAAYGSTPSDHPEGGHDLERVFSKLEFSSTAHFGLELVDILTNSLRRALIGNLQEPGWHNLPDLVIRRRNEESFHFKIFSDEQNLKLVNAPYQETFKKIAFGRKEMLSRNALFWINNETEKDLQHKQGHQ